MMTTWWKEGEGENFGSELKARVFDPIIIRIVQPLVVPPPSTYLLFRHVVQRCLHFKNKLKARAVRQILIQAFGSTGRRQSEAT